MVPTINARSRKTRKIAAIAVGALVLGLGATYTLASWNDSEWVSGTIDGNPNVGTSEFDVVQNTTSPFDDLAENWVEEPSSPGGELAFSPGNMALSPGTTVYAPVALTTTAVSVGGTVTLQSAEKAGDGSSTDDLLWSALVVSVWTAPAMDAAPAPPSACTADFEDDTTGWTQIVTDAPMGTEVASASQTLQSAGATLQHYCFAIELPTDPALPGETPIEALQGLEVAPAWEFQSVSN